MANYYYGTAITIGGEIKIRVKPENIQDDEVKELEMPLAHPIAAWADIWETSNGEKMDEACIR